MGVISVWEPTAGYNLIPNPSTEQGTTNWAALNTCTFTRSFERATKGVASLKAVTGTGTDDGVCQTTNLTVGYGSGTTYGAGSQFYFSADVYVATGTCRVGVQMTYTSGSLSTSTTTYSSGTAWNHYSATLTVEAARTLQNVTFWFYGTSGASSTFYVDAVQVENSSVETSYVDGDQPGCTWFGYPHVSTSARSGQLRAGGVLRDLDSYCGVRTVAVVGLGASPYDLLDRQYSTLPGNLVDGYRQSPREVTIICLLKEATLSALHATRKKLNQLFLPGRVYPAAQPVLVRYTGASASVEFECYYVSGLEGDIAGGSGNYEKIAIRLRATDPALYAVGPPQHTLVATERVALSLNTVATDLSGTWANLGSITPATARVNSVYPWSGGLIVGGLFDNLNGVAAADNIANVDFNGSVTAIGGGVNGEVHKLVYDPSANALVVCGAFTVADGQTQTRGAARLSFPSLAWTPYTHGGTGGLAGTVYDATCVNDCVYFVGNFGSANGLGNSACFVGYNPALGQFQAMHGGTVGGQGGTAAYLTAIDSDGVSIWVGGFCGTITSPTGGTAVQVRNLFIYNVTPATITSPGAVAPSTGIPWTMECVRTDDFVLAGSGITSVNGVACNNVMRRQNGVWTPMAPGFNDKVNEIAVRTGQGGDEFYAVGSFTDGGAYSVGGMKGAARYSTTWGPTSLALPSGNRAKTIGFVDENGNAAGLYVGLDGTAIVEEAAWATVTVTATGPCYPKIVFPYIAGRSGTPQIHEIRNESTNQSIRLDHQLVANEVYTVDCDYRANPVFGPSSRKKHIYSSMTGDAAGDLRSGSDLATFALQPGANAISIYSTDTSGTAGSAVVQYRDTYDSADL